MGKDIRKDAFENLVLTFDMHGKSVSGLLNGNYKAWLFDSDSPAFLKLIPSGRLTRQMNAGGVSSAILDLCVSIQRAAEDMGYNLHIKEQL
jgi:hypothetical protein